MGACTTASRDLAKLGGAERARGHMCRLLAYLWYCVGNSWGTNLALNCLLSTEHNMGRRIFPKQQHLWPPISQGRKALSSGVWMGEEGTWSQEVGGKVSPGVSQLFSSLSQQCHQGAQMERGKHCPRRASHKSKGKVARDWIREVDIAQVADEGSMNSLFPYH